MAKPSDLSEASDLELMARAREGDEDARREVVCRQGPRVFNGIYRIVRHQDAAEDLTQDTFVKMFRALERNGPDYFTLRHVEHRSVHEIAQILGLLLGTVKSHLHRGPADLREAVSGV